VPVPPPAASSDAGVHGGVLDMVLEDGGVWMRT